MSATQVRDKYSSDIRNRSIRKKMTNNRDNYVIGDICQVAVQEFEKNPEIEDEQVDDVLYDFGPSEDELYLMMEEQ